MDLAFAYVHRVNFKGPFLQEAVGEAAGGHAHIETDPAFDRDLKNIQCAFQFQPSARDIRAVAFD